MSIKERLDNYLLEKVSRSKVQHLFMVSKEHLFTKIHELNQQVQYLNAMNDNASTKAEILQTELTKSKKENNTLKTQLEARTDIKTELAYKGLIKEYEKLQSENKSIKATVDMVNNVVENTKKQNEQLKEKLKRTEHQYEDLKIHLIKEQEHSASVDIDLKRAISALNNKENNTIKHNFTRKANNSSKSMSLSK